MHMSTDMHIYIVHIHIYITFVIESNLSTYCFAPEHNVVFKTSIRRVELNALQSTAIDISYKCT